MGFLKRFFSLGSRKSKKKSRHAQSEIAVDSSGRILKQESRGQETDATRLLRSASAHFTGVSKPDYSNLPPLPHPINSVSQTPVATPARSTIGLQRKGTYNVTVHGRTLHSRTEFPNANPPLQEASKTEVDANIFAESPVRSHPNPRSVPLTPHDRSRVIRLRQDPSVASLLDMYDDKGRIKSSAFSNTPPTPGLLEEVDGREQKKRGGSTLRELLGEPESARKPWDNSVMEGDISWAERYIDEHANSSESLASTTSLPLETPKESTHPHDLSKPHVVTNTTFSTDASHSAIYPAISSMEVELSETNDITELEVNIDESYITNPPPIEPKTPQRPAIEVFGFLVERRKSVLDREKLSDGPTTRQQKTSTSTTPSATPAIPPSNNSSPGTTSDASSGQIHTATVTKFARIANPLSRSTETLNVLSSYTATPLIPSNTGRTTATTSSTGSQPSRIPRGPRPAPSSSKTSLPLYNPSETSLPRPSHEDIPRPPIPTLPGPYESAQPQDPFTPIRPRKHRLTASQASTSALSLASYPDDEPSTKPSAPPSKSSRSRTSGKENSAAHTSQPTSKSKSEPFMPKTPSRAIFESRHPNLVNSLEHPSPASSSDLSPMGRDMMANVRKERMKVRHGIRVASGGRSGQRR